MSEKNSSTINLKAIYEIKGTIHLESGLHIGGSESTMHIGGVDSPVIKNPHTEEPYIPGSSLKGKMRSLLEQTTGLIAFTNGKVLSNSVFRKHSGSINADQKKTAEGILRLFGSGGSDTEESIGPSRLSFADASLNKEWVEEQKKARRSLTEVKTENNIDRISGTAQHPRQTERVIAGAKFDFRITCKDLMEDDLDYFQTVLIRGLKLLELDAIGGSSSRGYGRIRFEIDENCMLGEKSVKGLLQNADPFKSANPAAK